MIYATKAGKYLVVKGHETEWSDREEDATVFASIAAFQQCLATGRLHHLGLRFVRWVR